MPIRCIIVEDEPLSLRIIETYVRNCPQLDLITTCSDGLEAREFLKSTKVDLVLLDINMPRLSGIQLIESLSELPLFIFTTAYPEYAVQGFNLDAIDFLLKPFSFERFLKAIDKVEIRLQQNRANNENHLFFKVDKKFIKVNPDEVLYLKSEGDYVKIILTDRELVVHSPMKELLEGLPDRKFLRIHKSFAVAIDRIESIEGNILKLNEIKLPVGPSFREELFKRLDLS